MRRNLAFALRALTLGGGALAVVLLGAAPAHADFVCGRSGPTMTVHIFPPAPNGTVTHTVSVAGAGADEIHVDGVQCGDATVSNVDTISVLPTSATQVGGEIVPGPEIVGSNQVLMIDLSGGGFGPGATPEAEGDSEIEWEIDLGTQGNADRIEILGGDGVDRIVVGTLGVNLNAGESVGDVDIEFENVNVLFINGLGGNDVISGAGGAGTGDASVFPLTVEGGEGADTITGGAGPDVISGGPGNDTLNGGDGDDTEDGGPGDDTFLQGASAGANGSDTLIGGDGSDTVVYTGRSAGVVMINDGEPVSGLASTVEEEPGEGDAIGTDIENLSGTAFADDIALGACAPGGNVIRLRGGHDEFTSVDVPCDDLTIEGNAGDDIILVAAGTRLTVNAGDGHDTIHVENLMGETSNINLGPGDDAAVTADGDDVIFGWTGHDLISSGAGNDVVHGQGGHDIIDGGEGDDIVNGGQGNDILLGGPGDDVLNGGDGHDTLVGGAGADTQNGGPGDDIFVEGAYEPADPDDPVDDAGDVITGGPGLDIVSYFGRARGVRASLDGKANDGYVGEGDNIATDVEGLTGTAFADILIGNAKANVLLGLGGSDKLFGLGGPDYLEGGGGNDILKGGGGNDWLIGGSGNDTLLGGSGNDRLEGTKGTNVLKGGAGHDHLIGGKGVDKLLGGQGSDLINARDGVRDFVDGGANPAGRGDRCIVDSKDAVRLCERVERKG